MSEMTVLKLYFPLAAKAKATRFWHHLSAPALAQHLLVAAKKSGIRQATLQHISSSYLVGEHISHHHPEASSMRHPQCLELVDTEKHLRKFLHDHAGELQKVRAILFQCTLPLEQ
ncbi:DUF190 domain-containing protein [Herbaspirillum camelliae]|uniref:DUF190 domain-containing protein n=1 Tax=Herbaspirillum camelliae TaxID=1892903 RepID=UPI000949C714|nr:DUF190 domain-containing protein [Herbaspirillum camelliae]